MARDVPGAQISTAVFRLVLMSVPTEKMSLTTLQEEASPLPAECACTPEPGHTLMTDALSPEDMRLLFQLQVRNSELRSALNLEEEELPQVDSQTDEFVEQLRQVAAEGHGLESELQSLEQELVKMTPKLTEAGGAVFCRHSYRKWTARRQSSNMRKAMKLQLFEGILRTVREHVCAFLPGSTKAGVAESFERRAFITVPQTEPCRPSMDTGEAGLFLVELAEVAVFADPPKSVDQSEYDASSCYGGPGPGPELGRLYKGDIVAAQACDAASPSEDWLRLLFDNPVRRLVVLGSTWHSEDSEEQLGSTDQESDDSQEDGTRLARVEGASCLAGGYVLRRHVLVGSMLTWAGPLRPQVGAEVCNGDKDLPQEAGLWPRDVLERFRATGVRPQWHDAPGEDALALYGEMTRHQVEEGLRSTAMFLSRAEAVLVVVGEMSADSAASHAPGRERWQGLFDDYTFEQMCTRQAFVESPESAWDFWLHVCRSCRQAAPHTGSGYDILASLCDESQGPGALRVALGSFVVTTCWDGLAASTLPDEFLWESHGTVQELRCSGACLQTWPVPEELLESKRRSLPTCPRCGEPALPGIRLNDETEFRTIASRAQEARFLAWHKRCSAASQILVLEIGCSPGSEGRRRAEAFAGDFDATRVRFVRLNRHFPALPRRHSGRGVALPLCSDALSRLKALMSALEMGAFVFQDSHGMGAEVVVRRDAPVEFAFRKATHLSTHGQTADVGFKASSVLHEHRTAELGPKETVKKDFFFSDRDAVPPVVRIVVTNFFFHDRNRLLQERLRQVWSLIKDLVEAFQAHEYQEKFEAARRVAPMCLAILALCIRESRTASFRTS
ncbi:cobB [Symbiodinium necroappetens]|uniref:CobB protein n=1 Tax=Symbiodinium necroappetens TaxID=1628268 RepID=A0A812IXZ7_9DINO|nr:cobB [Symbiodinium necroappetens]